MMDAADAARRRELQRRAFAPGGGLSADEAAELRALDARGRTPVVPPPAVATEHPMTVAAPVAGHPASASRAGTPPVDPIPANGPASDVSASETLRPVPDAGSTDAGADPVRPTRRRWMLPLVATLAALLGFGGGWLVFGRDAGPTMTAAQGETLATLEATGDYDPGSVQLLGEKYRVSVWGATQEASTVQCIIVTHEEQSSPACVDGEQFDPSDPEHSVQANLQYQDDGEDYMLWAGYVEDVTGRTRIVVQRYNGDMEWDWRSQYSRDELAIVDRLVDEGFDGEFLQIVGYDDTVPVWLYQADRTCVIVEHDGAFAQGCGELLYDSGQSLDLTIPGATYSVLAPSNRSPVLTIVRQSPSITCDVDTGYCASVDDTTGDLR